MLGVVDVRADAKPVAGSALLIPDRRSPAGEPAISSVGGSLEPELTLISRAGRDRLLPALPNRGPIMGMTGLGAERQGISWFRGQASIPTPFLARILRLTLRIGRPDDQRQRFRERPKAGRSALAPPTVSVSNGGEPTDEQRLR